MIETSWKRGLLTGVLGGALVAGVGMRLLWPSAATDGPDPAGDIARAEDRERVLEILEADLERGLERWYSGDPFGYSDLYAEELSYFDPGTDVSLDGIEALRAYYEPLVGRFIVERYETAGSRLQLHGDLAILTFNLNEYATGDTPSAEWKVTHVYRKLGGEWRVVHGHFSSVGAG